MKMQVESTHKIVNVDGVPMRLWEGTTEEGIVICALIAQVVVDPSDITDLDREYQNHKTPDTEIASHLMGRWPTI